MSDRAQICRHYTRVTKCTDLISTLPLFCLVPTDRLPVEHVVRAVAGGGDLPILKQGRVSEITAKQDLWGSTAQLQQRKPSGCYIQAEDIRQDSCTIRAPAEVLAGESVRVRGTLLLLGGKGDECLDAPRMADIEDEDPRRCAYTYPGPIR